MDSSHQISRFEAAPGSGAGLSTSDALRLVRVEQAVETSRAALLDLRAEDGHWRFELEADATIPAEYILLNHFLDELEPDLERRIAGYLRSIQGEHGGWPLFHQGAFNISATVKAYYALKLAGDDIDAPHMVRARKAILAHGGAARCNVFTRITLALYGQVPWKAVPVMPVEMMLLPEWAPFHLSKMSYWSRTVLVPLLILMSLKPQARNPRGVGIAELFEIPADQVTDWLENHTGSPWGEAFLWLDKALRIAEPRFPRDARKRAIERAVEFIRVRLNGEDGLGAIFPAMANSVMAFDTLGYAADHPDRITARGSVNKLLVVDGERVYCQPCVSPIWDTVLAMHAVLEADGDRPTTPMASTTDWILERQVLDVVGDWATRRPNVRPGGWAFQYRNDYYPDLDDTAVVGMALHRAHANSQDPRVRVSLERAAEWVMGLQSRTGGWASFDADNLHYYLNHIPFADHGALLDPPTSDVTARCIGFLAQIGYRRDHQAIARGIDYLKREQEADGSWFGRWGTNYIYGTWSVLCALNAAGEDPASPYIRKAVSWLRARQRDDGGWGEDGATYWQATRGENKASTPSQTAWAVLGLMAAGEVSSDSVRRGVDFMLAAPREGARWEEEFYTAVGFPRVFYLRYHGYAAYFPLWALARYRNLMRGNSRHVAYGM